MFSRTVTNFSRIGIRNFSVPKECYLPETVVASRVIEVVKSFRHCPPDVNTTDAFGANLYFDSLHMKDLAEKLSAEFCVKLDPKEASSFSTIDSAIKYFASHPKAR